MPVVPPWLETRRLPLSQARGWCLCQSAQTGACTRITVGSRRGLLGCTGLRTQPFGLHLRGGFGRALGVGISPGADSLGPVPGVLFPVSDVPDFHENYSFSRQLCQRRLTDGLAQRHLTLSPYLWYHSDTMITMMVTQARAYIYSGGVYRPFPGGRCAPGG